MTVMTAGRNRAGRPGMAAMTAIPKPMTAERETARNEASVTMPTGVHHRARLRPPSPTMAQASARGRATAMAVAYSSGCVAVPAGRMKPPRLSMPPASPVNPGNPVRKSMIGWSVRNWTRPRTATAAPANARRRTSFMRSLMLRMPSIATRTTPVHDNNLTIADAAGLIWSNGCPRSIACAKLRRQTTRNAPSAIRAGCGTERMLWVGCRRASSHHPSRTRPHRNCGLPKDPRTAMDKLDGNPYSRTM